MRVIKNYKWMPIVYGVLLMVVGILTMIFAISDSNIVDQVISISLAGGLFLIGLLNIALSLIAHSHEFFTSSILVGALSIAFGIVLLVNRQLIAEFIIYLLGSFLIGLGAVCLIKAILFISYKEHMSWTITHFVIAAIAIGLGITVLCFNRESKQILYSFIGAVIALTGLIEIIIVAKRLVEERRAFQQAAPAPEQPKAKSKVVEANVVEVTPVEHKEKEETKLIEDKPKELPDKGTEE